MSKPRVHCEPSALCFYRDGVAALLSRTSHHPRLGDPSPGQLTRTSKVIRVDFKAKEIETLNTIYYWS